MECPHPEPQERNSPLLRFVEIARRQGPQFEKSHRGFVRQGSAFHGSNLERRQIALDPNEADPLKKPRAGSTPDIDIFIVGVAFYAGRPPVSISCDGSVGKAPVCPRPMPNLTQF